MADAPGGPGRSAPTPGPVRPVVALAFATVLSAALMIAGLGVIVGGIVVSMYLPLVELVGQLS